MELTTGSIASEAQKTNKSVCCISLICSFPAIADRLGAPRHPRGAPFFINNLGGFYMETLDLNKVLTEHPYPGRGIMLGRSADGKKAVIA